MDKELNLNDEGGEAVDPVDVDVKVDASFFDGPTQVFDPEDTTLLEYEPPEMIESSSADNISLNYAFPAYVDHLDKPPKDPLATLMTECVPIEESAAASYDRKNSDSIELQHQLLDLIHSPEEWFDENEKQRYIRHISSLPADESHALALEVKLNRMLQKRGARQCGVCPIRRQLFDELFDELIRQISLTTPERGIMLMVCREEIRQTRAAYQALFGGSETFIAGKSVVRFSDEILAKNVAVLREESAGIKKIVQHLKEELVRGEVKHTEELDKMQKRQNEELDFLRSTNNAYRKQISIISGTKMKDDNNNGAPVRTSKTMDAKKSTVPRESRVDAVKTEALKVQILKLD